MQKRLNRSRCRLGCWVGCTHRLKEPGTRLGPDPHAKGKFLGERTCPGIPDDTVSWAVHTWLNRSRWRLDCGLGSAERSMCYTGAHWRLLSNTIEPSVCRGDVALCHITLTLVYSSTTTTRTTTIVFMPFVRDYAGEPVPEETFTHPILIIIQSFCCVVLMIAKLEFTLDM